MEKLTFLEIDKLIEEAKNGSQEAKEKIVGSYMKYLYKKAFSCNVTAMDIEDIISIGTIKILQCIKNYDISINDNFTSYVTYAINNYLINLQMRNQKKYNLNTAIDEVAAILVDKEDTYETVICNMERKSLRNALSSLTEKEKNLIDNIYFKRKSLKNIAEELDVNYVTVINRRNIILKKLLRLLEE